jgi:hypothetical protein
VTAIANSLPARLTYAQNPCCGAAKIAAAPAARYQSHSARKSLIYKGLRECTFSGHSSQALDFPGLWAVSTAAINKVIHSKTGFMVKALWNQRLNGAFICRA